MQTERRNSKKRQAIYDALCASYAHPSADQLYSMLKPSIPDLSLGTVYRNIGVLLDEGLIINVGCVDGEMRYDARTDPHPHFVCSKCSGISDLELDFPDKEYYPEIEVLTDGKVLSHSLCFFGLCRNCK